MFILRDRAAAVDRHAERVDDAPEQRVAHRDRKDASGRSDQLALFDLVCFPEHDRADRLLLEVQREPERAALELEQLVDGRVRKARDARDAVADLEHTPDLRAVDGRPETLDALAENRGDVARIDREFRH